MGLSAPSGRVLLLWSLLWSLLVLSALAHDQPRRAAFYVRVESSTTSATTSATDSSSSPASSSVSSSPSSFSTFSSTSVSHSSSSISHTSSAPASTTTTSSSSTSVTTTATSSSQTVSSTKSSASTSSTHSTSRTTAVFVQTPSTTPATTLDTSPDIATTAPNDPSPSASGNPQVNAASTGFVLAHTVRISRDTFSPRFWGNKGAVGGTFTVVALVVVGILVALAVVLRRRAANHKSARDTFFDTKNPVERNDRLSSGPSMVSLGNEPMDAHSTPIPNYGSADQYLVDTADYSVTYPPGSSYPPVADHPPAPEQYYSTPAPDQHYVAEQDPYYAQSNNAYEAYNQYYTADAGAAENNYSVAPANHRPSLSPHPYSHPSHASAGPSAMRDFAGRDSAYQQSIDSFYGAAGTAL
ncbi:hypothetical protein B0H11DRAFT_1022083 [Mycena galericulata]|nr:hypothetical protein B0H11DRAFT_1022083 [Mycena galericulata]